MLMRCHNNDVTNTSLAWAGRVWRGRVISTCPGRVPLFGCPFVRPDTNDLISTSPAPAHLLLRNSFVLDDSSLRNSFVLVQNCQFTTTCTCKSFLRYALCSTQKAPVSRRQ